MSALESLLKHLKIKLVENRSEDAWFDLSTRQMRKGPVTFYNVKDPLTGEWLFKVCKDPEAKKVIVKALKCPPGTRYAQLEGNSMVFQESTVEGVLYDVVSLTQIDQNEKISRKIPTTPEEIPAFIKENFEIKPYEEAAGKQAPGKHLVTLCKSGDEKAMVTLFLLERAWTIAPTTPEEKAKAMEAQQAETPKKVKREIDTAQVWTCPICGKQHRLIHIETEKTVRHALRKTGLETKLF
ncbi:MAG: hypothetical protein RMJ15_04160 [Nitrososphaerota archaeon]|nr:hypothetical protein [Nitrososphaerota archaeon]